jgi:hypothetical protein
MKLEGTPIWIAVASAIDDLVQNDDLVERTARNYIVGYLSQRIVNERQDVIDQLEESPDSYPQSKQSS